MTAAAVLTLALSSRLPVLCADDGAAQQILKSTVVTGGLVVHLADSTGSPRSERAAELMAAFHGIGGFLVQGLDLNPAGVEQTRRRLRSLGVYGPVSVDRLSGRSLPYVDNLVNLIVVADPVDIPEAEMMRVLAPGGVGIDIGQTPATTFRKPYPDEMDEWTHYLHDATNNAVAHDTVVGPPKHLQWVGSPNWARHHDRMASLSACVSAKGRIFYIFDEGPTAAILLPPRWTLVARDAFNGTVLWKRQLPTWHPHLWPMKSGFAQLPRRLIAVGDRVYVTLGLEVPLSCLDAATGKTLRVYDGTKTTEEVIFSENVLFAVVNEGEIIHKNFAPAHKQNMWDAMRRAANGWPWGGTRRWIVATQAETGKVLWKTEQRVVPLSLAANEEFVFFHDGEAVVGLNRHTGGPAWRSGPLAIGFPKQHFSGGAKGEEAWAPSSLPSAFVPASFAPTLVVRDGVVLFAGGNDTMTALSAANGKALWSVEHPPSGHFSPQDLFVIDGRVWSGAISKPQHLHSGVFTGRDLHTGEITSEISCDTDAYFMHQRCYRSKATDRYLIPSRTGTEFIGLEDKHWQLHHWVRGGCMYGVMPCNGLLYATPNSCACYMLAKLPGFNALAASRQPIPKTPETELPPRLEKGPAYLPIRDPQSAIPNSSDWPTYRHDPARSGSTSTTVTVDLKREWQVDLGGKLSAVVVAGGKVFVTQIDAHTVYAIDAETGGMAWQFTAGARIDSPPTIYRDTALFGCADGWVYCLRCADGALAWRHRAAPENARLVSFEQLESVWPVHGSVLVQDDVLYCVAGRSMYLDGGIRLLKLDPATGRLLAETVFSDQDTNTEQDLQANIKGRNMPVALPDVLSSDGRSLFMRTQRLDLDGNRQDVTPRSANDVEEAAMQIGEGMHLFSPIGFLDGSWWHRAYWVYGTRFATGAGGYSQAEKFAPAGRILVYDDEGIYGYGRKPTYYRWTTPLEYRLFGAAKDLTETEVPVGRAPAGKKARRIPASAPEFRWTEDIPLQARAMVLARQTLFVAGPPDVANEEKAFYRLDQAGVQEQLARQSAALEGKEGALLWAVNTSNGEKLATFKLDSPPVWDGMSAARNKLFLATLSGQVLCLGEAGEPLPEAPVEQVTFTNSDLVGYWQFDEGEGAVAKDSSEYCNDGGCHATWTKGIKGTAVLFAADDDQVEIPDTESLNITGAITLMAWIKPDEQTAQIPMILIKAAAQGKYILRVDAQRHLTALFWNGEQRAATIRSEEVISKDWHHIAVTYDPLQTGKLRLYMDGQVIAEQTSTEAWGNPAGGPVTLSGRGKQAFKGAVDEVRIYNRALPPDEVKQIARGL